MAEPISNWKENENGKINPNTSFMFPPCFHLFHCVCVLRLLSKRGFALADVCLLKKRTCMLGLQQLQRHHVETDRTMIGHLGLLVFSPTKFLMQVEIVTSKIVIVGKKKRINDLALFKYRKLPSNVCLVTYSFSNEISTGFNDFRLYSIQANLKYGCLCYDNV